MKGKETQEEQRCADRDRMFYDVPAILKRANKEIRQQPSHSPPGGFRAARLGGEWPAAGSTYHKSNCKVAGLNIRVHPCPQSPVSQRSRLVAQIIYRTEFMTPIAFQAKRN
jgi:hypothetical protein